MQIDIKANKILIYLWNQVFKINTKGRVSVLKEPKRKKIVIIWIWWYNTTLLRLNPLSDAKGVINLQNHKLIWSNQNNFTKAQNTWELLQILVPRTKIWKAISGWTPPKLVKFCFCFPFLLLLSVLLLLLLLFKLVHCLRDTSYSAHKQAEVHFLCSHTVRTQGREGGTSHIGESWDSYLTR